MAVVSFYREKDADFINESSFTIVSTITQVDDRYIYYRFKFEDEYYNSSFRIKQKYDGLLSKGDKLFVRFATDNPEINFCIFPQLRSANQFATNLVLDTLNTELVSAGWIGNNPHNHYSR
tara:strand:+ start:250 stop:609 length:360 start_codon:yes stop_codon:yes gene_type:complete